MHNPDHHNWHARKGVLVAMLTALASPCRKTLDSQDVIPIDDLAKHFRLVQSTRHFMLATVGVGGRVPDNHCSRLLHLHQQFGNGIAASDTFSEASGADQGWRTSRGLPCASCGAPVAESSQSQHRPSTLPLRRLASYLQNAVMPLLVDLSAWLASVLPHTERIPAAGVPPDQSISNNVQSTVINCRLMQRSMRLVTLPLVHRHGPRRRAARHWRQSESRCFPTTVVWRRPTVAAAATAR